MHTNGEAYAKGVTGRIPWRDLLRRSHLPPPVIAECEAEGSGRVNAAAEDPTNSDDYRVHVRSAFLGENRIDDVSEPNGGAIETS